MVKHLLFFGYFSGSTLLKMCSELQLSNRETENTENKLFSNADS